MMREINYIPDKVLNDNIDDINNELLALSAELTDYDYDYGTIDRTMKKAIICRIRELSLQKECMESELFNRQF